MEILLAVLFCLDLISSVRDPAYAGFPGYTDTGMTEQALILTAEQDKVQSIDIYDRRENE